MPPIDGGPWLKDGVNKGGDDTGFGEDKQGAENHKPEDDRRHPHLAVHPHEFEDL